MTATRLAIVGGGKMGEALLAGLLGAQWARGLQNDVYCQIGLVMLVGLASKNAILIVEFAEQLRHRGMPLIEATVEAAGP